MHLSYHNDRVYSCRFCNVKHSKLASYRKHLQLVHPECLQNGVLIRNSSSEKDQPSSGQGKQLTISTVPETQISPVVEDEKVVDEDKDTMKRDPEENNEITVDSFVLKDDGEELGEVEVWEGEIKSPKSGKRSRFNFACTVCKKKFNCYVNMCRHRRVAHRQRKYGQPTLLRQREAAQLRDTIIVSDYIPIPTEMKYENVAENIATNLNLYLDGGQEAMASCHKYIKIHSVNSVVKLRSAMPGPVTWTKFNFPSTYQPWEGVVGYDIDEELFKVYDDLEIQKPAEGRNIRRRCRGADPDESNSELFADAKNKLTNSEVVDTKQNESACEINSKLDNTKNKNENKTVCDRLEEENSTDYEVKSASELIPSAVVKNKDGVDNNTRDDAITKENLNITAAGDLQFPSDYNTNSESHGVQNVKIENLDEEYNAKCKIHKDIENLEEENEAKHEIHNVIETVDDELISECEIHKVHERKDSDVIGLCDLSALEIKSLNCEEIVTVESQQNEENVKAQLSKTEDDVRMNCQNDLDSSSGLSSDCKDMCEAASLELVDHFQTGNGLMRQNSDSPPVLIPAMVKQDRRCSSGNSSDDGSFGSPPPLLSLKDLDDELQTQSEYSGDGDHRSSTEILTAKENLQSGEESQCFEKKTSDDNNKSCSHSDALFIAVDFSENNQQCLEVPSNAQPPQSRETCNIGSREDISHGSGSPPSVAGENTHDGASKAEHEADNSTTFCKQEEISTNMHTCDSDEKRDLSLKSSPNSHLFGENLVHYHSIDEKQYNNHHNDDDVKCDKQDNCRVPTHSENLDQNSQFIVCGRNLTNDKSEHGISKECMNGSFICKDNCDNDTITVKCGVENDLRTESNTKNISSGCSDFADSNKNEGENTNNSLVTLTIATTPSVPSHTTQDNSSTVITCVNQNNHNKPIIEQKSKHTSQRYLMKSHSVPKKKSKMSKVINLENIVEKMKAIELHTEQREINTAQKNSKPTECEFLYSRNMISVKSEKEAAVLQATSREEDYEEKCNFEMSTCTRNMLTNIDKSQSASECKVNQGAYTDLQSCSQNKFENDVICGEELANDECKMPVAHVTHLDVDPKNKSRSEDSKEHEMYSEGNDIVLDSSVVNVENGDTSDKDSKMHLETNSEGSLQQKNELGSQHQYGEEIGHDSMDVSTESLKISPISRVLDISCRDHLKKDCPLPLEHENNSLFPDSVKHIPHIPSLEASHKVADVSNACTCSSDAKIETTYEAKSCFKSDSVDCISLSDSNKKNCGDDICTSSSDVPSQNVPNELKSPHFTSVVSIEQSVELKSIHSESKDEMSMFLSGMSLQPTYPVHKKDITVCPTLESSSDSHSEVSKCLSVVSKERSEELDKNNLKFTKTETASLETGPGQVLDDCSSLVNYGCIQPEEGNHQSEVPGTENDNCSPCVPCVKPDSQPSLGHDSDPGDLSLMTFPSEKKMLQSTNSLHDHTSPSSTILNSLQKEKTSGPPVVSEPSSIDSGVSIEKTSALHSVPVEKITFPPITYESTTIHKEKTIPRDLPTENSPSQVYFAHCDPLDKTSETDGSEQIDKLCHKSTSLEHSSSIPGNVQPDLNIQNEKNDSFIIGDDNPSTADGDSVQSLTDSINDNSEDISTKSVSSMQCKPPDSVEELSIKKRPDAVKDNSVNSSVCEMPDSVDDGTEEDVPTPNSNASVVFSDGVNTICGLAGQAPHKCSVSSIEAAENPSASGIHDGVERCDAETIVSACDSLAKNDSNRTCEKHDTTVRKRKCCNKCVLETSKELALDSNAADSVGSVGNSGTVQNVEADFKQATGEEQLERVKLLKILNLQQNGSTDSGTADTESDVGDDSKACRLESEAILATSNTFRHFLRPVEDPLQNYENVVFGKQGKVVCVCAICRRQYVSIDLLLRHHWKKHPSVDFRFIEVEQGSDADLLFFPWPCNFGLLASALPIADDYRSLGVYRCTRCASKFKNINRLHVHIINCDPNHVPVIPSHKRKKIQKRMRSKLVDFKVNQTDVQTKSNPLKLDTGPSETPIEPKGFTGCRRRRIMRSNVDAVMKLKKKRNYELLYNPHNHVRRREMVSVLDTHQCSGCRAKFKSLHLLERHATKCSNKETLQSLKPVQNKFIDEVTQKRRHICHYCSKHFIYLKSLANHYRAFCPVRKEKRRCGLIADTDLEQEKLVRKQLECQEQEVQDDKNNGKKRKGGWPKGMKRKKRRKKRTWTIVKRRKPSSAESEGPQVMISSPLWNVDLYQDYTESVAGGEPEEERIGKQETIVQKQSESRDEDSSTAFSVGNLQKTPEPKNAKRQKLRSKSKRNPRKSTTKKLFRVNRKSQDSTRNLFTEDNLNSEDNTNSKSVAKSNDVTAQSLVVNKMKQKGAKYKTVKNTKEMDSVVDFELDEEPKNHVGMKNTIDLKKKERKSQNENEDDLENRLKTSDVFYPRTETLCPGTGKKLVNKTCYISNAKKNLYSTTKNKSKLSKKTRNQTSSKLCSATNYLKSRRSGCGSQEITDHFVQEGMLCVKAVNKTAGKKVKVVGRVPKKRVSVDVPQKLDASDSCIQDRPVIANNKNKSVVNIFKVDTSNQLPTKKGQKKRLTVLSQTTPTMIKSICKKKSSVGNKYRKKNSKLKNGSLTNENLGLVRKKKCTLNNSSIIPKCDKTFEQTTTSLSEDEPLSSKPGLCGSSGPAAGILKAKPSSKPSGQASTCGSEVMSIPPDTQPKASPQKSAKKFVSGPKCSITETLDEVAANWQGNPTARPLASPKCKAIKRLLLEDHSNSPGSNVNIDTVFKKRKPNSLAKLKKKTLIHSKNTADISFRQKSPQKISSFRASKMKT